MTDSFTVELVTPEELLFSAGAEMVIIPGAEGDFGVLVDHAPMVAIIRPGIIHIQETASVSRDIFVGGGFAEVTGDRTVILVDEAVDIHAIDSVKAAARLEKAEYALEHAKHDKEKEAAEKEIAVVQAMLVAKG